MGMLVLHGKNQREPGLILISVAYEHLKFEPSAQDANGKFVIKYKVVCI